jgi:hypothetical protein
MKKNKLFSLGIGLWASGMLVGANAVDLLPIGPPSWPPEVLFSIGLLIGIISLVGLYRVDHPSGT